MTDRQRRQLVKQFQLDTRRAIARYFAYAARKRSDNPRFSDSARAQAHAESCEWSKEF